MKNGEGSVTFLGKGTRLEGKLKFEGTIRVDGRFAGEIVSDGNLVVGQGGYVEADIRVGYVTISGEVHGNILATEKVEIQAPGKVFGDIKAPSVVIGDGVVFEGRTEMYRPKEPQRPPADAAEPQGAGDDAVPTLGIVFGVVRDRYSGVPVSGVQVKCKGAAKRYTATDDLGYYEVSNLRDGKWKIEIKAKGYGKDKAIVHISGGGRYEQNFE